MAIESIATALEAPLLTAKELEDRLRHVGTERYHHQHPFHVMMHEGRLSRRQMQVWALKSLLLPEPDSHQGRDRSFAQRGCGIPQGMAQKSGGSRRRCGAGKRHLALGASRTSDGPIDYRPLR